jgi:hypothetical protein
MCIAYCPAFISMSLPVRYVRKFMKRMCLSKEEIHILEEADLLYNSVNVETNCCECFPQLGKTETMLLRKVLQDEERTSLREYREFCEMFGEHLKETTGEDTAAGQAITEDEFSDAMLVTVAEYVRGMVQTLGDEVKAEYEEMNEEFFEH